MGRSKYRFLKMIIWTAPFMCIFLSLFIGRYPVDGYTVIKVLSSGMLGKTSGLSPIYDSLILDIRLPRAVLGAVVGGSLAISGGALQGLFRNPLVDAGILGVSSGAAFGAALAILLFRQTFMIYLFAFVFGILAVYLSYQVGKIYHTAANVMLVLGGVVVSSVFSALVSFIKFVADPYDQLPQIVFWLMGSLASSNIAEIKFSVIPMTAGIIGLLAIRWRINVLSMGDKEAQALGVDLTIAKGIVIISTTMATAAAVCVSGTIGWIGLIIPHVGRMLVGNDNKVLLPVSLSLGACFLILIDNMGRIISEGELPLNILTALLGAPFYVYLIKKTKGGGW